MSEGDIFSCMHIITLRNSNTMIHKNTRETLTDEVVVLAWVKLQASRLRREGSEGDGEVHEFVRLITHSYDPRRRVGDATSVVLLLAHLRERKCRYYKSAIIIPLISY